MDDSDDNFTYDEYDNIIEVKRPAGISSKDKKRINELIKEHNKINSELDKEIDNSDAQSWDSKHSRKIDIIRNINDTIQKYKPLPLPPSPFPFPHHHPSTPFYPLHPLLPPGGGGRGGGISSQSSPDPFYAHNSQSSPGPFHANSHQSSPGPFVVELEKILSEMESQSRTLDDNIISLSQSQSLSHALPSQSQSQNQLIIQSNFELQLVTELNKSFESIDTQLSQSTQSSQSLSQSSQSLSQLSQSTLQNNMDVLCLLNFHGNVTGRIEHRVPLTNLTWVNSATGLGKFGHETDIDKIFSDAIMKYIDTAFDINTIRYYCRRFERNRAKLCNQDMILEQIHLVQSDNSELWLLTMPPTKNIQYEIKNLFVLAFNNGQTMKTIKDFGDLIQTSMIPIKNFGYDFSYPEFEKFIEDELRDLSTQITQYSERVSIENDAIKHVQVLIIGFIDVVLIEHTRLYRIYINGVSQMFKSSTGVPSFNQSYSGKLTTDGADDRFGCHLVFTKSSGLYDLLQIYSYNPSKPKYSVNPVEFHARINNFRILSRTTIYDSNRNEIANDDLYDFLKWVGDTYLLTEDNKEYYLFCLNLLSQDFNSTSNGAKIGTIQSFTHFLNLLEQIIKNYTRKPLNIGVINLSCLSYSNISQAEKDALEADFSHNLNQSQPVALTTTSKNAFKHRKPGGGGGGRGGGGGSYGGSKNTRKHKRTHKKQLIKTRQRKTQYRKNKK